MRQENILKILAMAVIIVLLLVIWMLLRLNRLEKQITQTVLSAIPSLTQNPPFATSTLTEQPPVPLPASRAITTAIVFSTLSSPELQPQMPITITVENVSKSEEGVITMNIKAFTNEATAYSALAISKLFALVDLERGAIQIPSEIKGSFNSLPPKSTTNGQIIFEIAPTKNKIILQIGSPENPKFYEFDFDKKTYKETQVG